MFKPSFEPCSGAWTIGEGGRVFLKIGNDTWEVPDHQKVLIYIDLVRAYEELYGGGPIRRLRDKAVLYARRFLRRPLVVVDPTEQLSDEEVRTIFASIGPNGQRVLVELCRRIKRGHDAYGDFPKRDWNQERRDELFDAMVYEVAESLQADGKLEDP
jgi:hypothetical protein